MRRKSHLTLLVALALLPALSAVLLGCASTDDLQKEMADSGVPVISTVVPSQGRVGSAVAVRGVNFGDTAGDIGFQDPVTGTKIQARIVSWASDLILTEVPSPSTRVTSDTKTQIGLATTAGKVVPVFYQFTIQP